MIQEILLTNENFIRATTVIDTNLQSKYLLSAMRESQDVYLQQIIGKSMLDKLKELVSDGSIDDSENAAYKSLLDECQLFLAYQSVANLCLTTNVKLSNGGLQQTSDENLSVLNVNDTFTIQSHFQDKADFYARRLQEYILNNKTQLPEISERRCNQMNSNLYSTATSSIWLGGPRGKIRGYRRNCHL